MPNYLINQTLTHPITQPDCDRATVWLRASACLDEGTTLALTPSKDEKMLHRVLSHFLRRARLNLREKKWEAIELVQAKTTQNTNQATYYLATN